MPTAVEATELQIFQRLAFKSALETGLDFEFDKKYKDEKAIRNAVMYIYRKVKDNSERYGLQEQARTIVLDAMAHRNIAGLNQEITKAEKDIEATDIKTLVIGVRDKAFRALDKKLTRALKSKRALDQIPIQSLSTAAGTMFDKAQIIQGMATEHVALMGKIEGNINPKDALDLVLRMREKNVQSHQK